MCHKSRRLSSAPVILQYLALSALRRVAHRIVAGGAHQAEALRCPRHLISEHLHVVPMVLPYPKFCVTYTASVPLRLVHLAPELFANGGALRPEELLHHAAYRRAE